MALVVKQRKTDIYTLMRLLIRLPKNFMWNVHKNQPQKFWKEMMGYTFRGKFPISSFLTLSFCMKQTTQIFTILLGIFLPLIVQNFCRTVYKSVLGLTKMFLLWKYSKNIFVNLLSLGSKIGCFCWNLKFQLIILPPSIRIFYQDRNLKVTVSIWWTVSQILWDS